MGDLSAYLPFRIIARLLVALLLTITLIGAQVAGASEATPSAAEPTPVPTAVPTQVPTAAPAEVPTAMPTVAPTSEPTGDPTAESTIEPTPTEAITPTAVPQSISWSQPDPITCTIHTGNSTLDYGDRVVWRCVTSLEMTTTGDLPDDLATIWTLQAAYNGDQVSIRLPEGSKAKTLPPDERPEGIDARIRVRTPFDQQQLTFEVVVDRTSCTVGDATLRLTSDPSFEHADGVTVIRSDTPAETPFKLTTTAAASGEPSIRFDHPIEFEDLNATSTGLDSNISRGSAVLVIEGEWNPCATWTLSLSGGVTSTEIAPTLRVVSINNDPISGGACDLSSPCDLVTLAQSGDAATPQVLTVQLELILDPLTPPGSFGITVSAELNAVSAQP